MFGLVAALGLIVPPSGPGPCTCAHCTCRGAKAPAPAPVEEFDEVIRPRLPARPRVPAPAWPPIIAAIAASAAGAGASFHAFPIEGQSP